MGFHVSKIPPERIKRIQRFCGGDDGRKEEIWGIHPFDKLCHTCPMLTCDTGKNGCLRKRVSKMGGYVNAEGNPKLENMVSWETMTRIMIKAGMVCFLSEEMIAVFDLEDMVKEYKQYPAEHFGFDHPERVKASKMANVYRAKRRCEIEEEEW